MKKEKAVTYNNYPMIGDYDYVKDVREYEEQHKVKENDNDKNSDTGK